MCHFIYNLLRLNYDSTEIISTCWVFFPACSLCLWKTCFGYLLPNRSDNWSLLLMTDVATRKLKSLLSRTCSSNDGTNFSKGTSSGTKFWAVVTWDFCTISTTNTTLNRWLGIVCLSENLKRKFENLS